MKRLNTYIYSHGSNILYDKSCTHVDKISNGNLCTSEKYLPAKKQCPDCALKAYIRAGGNVSDRDDYISFFERVNIDENLIRHIFVVMKAKTSIFRNVMTLEIRGEKWKVKMQAIRRKIYSVLRIGSLRPNRMIYYVDGDNCSVQRIEGIEMLNSKDMVKIFCAKNSSYFKNHYRREELKQRCDCKIIFILVKPGPDAVDFAIGMDAYAECVNNPNCQMYFISGDKHFRVIKQQIKQLTKNTARVAQLGTIEDAKLVDNKKEFNSMWACLKEVEV